MAKLRKAICGENNKNLKDLDHMTGILEWKYLLKLFLSRVLSN